MTPDSASILHDLDLLDDWLAGKGYGEEAGLVLRAMTLINQQARELRELRASKHDLEDARALRALRVENEKLREEHQELEKRAERLLYERNVYLTDNAKHGVEIEKLRAEIEEVKRLYKYHVDLVSKGICEANELREENEKLRAALVEEAQCSERENRRKRMYYLEVREADKVIAGLRAENEKLRAALKPFADEASVGPMPGEPDDPRRCNMKFLRAAAAALKESNE